MACSGFPTPRWWMLLVNSVLLVVKPLPRAIAFGQNQSRLASGLPIRLTTPIRRQSNFSRPPLHRRRLRMAPQHRRLTQPPFYQQLRSWWLQQEKRQWLQQPQRRRRSHASPEAPPHGGRRPIAVLGPTCSFHLDSHATSPWGRLAGALQGLGPPARKQPPS